MRYISLLLLIAALAGCGSSDKPAPKPIVPPPVAKTPSPARPMARAITEEELGIHYFPGARVVLALASGKSLSANLDTPLPADQVVAFYEKELGSKASQKADMISIDGSKGDKRYSVAITSSKGLTSILIMGQMK